MTSCVEATYFLKNCPSTKMDGDGDGIPCESQWCSSGSDDSENNHRSRRRRF
ncbi:excalibur calcium-binding domain-containing protein [Nitrosomonas sp.]